MVFDTSNLSLGKPSMLEEKEHPDWVPSLLLGYGSLQSESSLIRYRRAKRRLTVNTPKYLG